MAGKREFQYDVFLSYSAKDKGVVRSLAERLRQDGLKVWFDEWVLKPGDSIPAKIEGGLEHSRVLVLCMSAQAFGADWAQLEAGTFRFRDPVNKERHFIPLRLDDAPIKGSLAQFLYINWPPVDCEREYAKLLEACRRRDPLIETQEAGREGWNLVRPEEIVIDRDSRHDFLARVKDTLARRVGMLCSNPACRRSTSGPQSEPDKAINIGVAAHIAAASSGGPRYSSSQTKGERSSIQNGIWLCQNCAKLVDSDEARFTLEVLRQWKKDAEDAARRGIESGENARNSSQAIKHQPTGGARKRVSHAQELARSGKLSEAIKEMTDALAVARDEKDEDEEVEILLGLALLSSDRHRRGDRQHYFQEAEKRADHLKAPSAKVIYFRAKAAALEEKRELTGAEEAYKAALAVCATAKDDENGSLATQACIVRSSFVHFLCSQGRCNEARPILVECEDYSRKHPDAEEAELLQAALEAGIHFSLDTKDEDGAVNRTAELESTANTVRLAGRIGRDLLNIANQASHRNMHQAALCAARTAVRLGHRCDDGKSPGFLAGALYTEAVVLLKAGQDEKSLAKAEAVLGLCRHPED